MVFSVQLRDSLRFACPVATFTVSECNRWESQTVLVHTGGPGEGILQKKKPLIVTYIIETRCDPQLNTLRLPTRSVFYLCSKKCAFNLVRQVQWCYISGPKGNVNGNMWVDLMFSESKLALLPVWTLEI